MVTAFCAFSLVQVRCLPAPCKRSWLPLTVPNTVASSLSCLGSIWRRATWSAPFTSLRRAWTAGSSGHAASAASLPVPGW